MNIPTEYIYGYEKARAVDPERADNYVAHTQIGDPEADALMEELSDLPRSEATRYLQAAMDAEDESELADAPPLMR